MLELNKNIFSKMPPVPFSQKAKALKLENPTLLEQLHLLNLLHGAKAKIPPVAETGGKLLKSAFTASRDLADT